jgi:hypothetical protein
MWGIFDLTASERVDVILAGVDTGVDEGVGVGVDDVATSKDGGVSRTRAAGLFDGSLGLGEER